MLLLYVLNWSSNILLAANFYGVVVAWDYYEFENDVNDGSSSGYGIYSINFAISSFVLFEKLLPDFIKVA